MKSKKVRISEIARVSGLSTATVDRVLNDRPGVRAVTREKVKKAIQWLERSPDAARARQLEAKRSLEILISEGSNPFFNRLHSGFDAALKPLTHSGLRVLRGGFDPYDPASVVDRLSKVACDTDIVISVGVDSPEVEAEINALVDRGVRVITIVSDVPGSKRVAFVGHDNFLAGRTAGRLMSEIIRVDAGSVAMLIGHLQFRHLLDRQSGFQQVMGIQRPNVSILSTRPYGTDPKNALEIVSDLFVQNPNLNGLYLPGGGQPELVTALADLKPADCTIIGHEVTPVSWRALKDGVFKYVLAHDVIEIARKALDVAFALEADHLRCEVHIYVQDNFPNPHSET